MSLYDQLGQEPGITKAVHEFYERVLADPSLQHYFADADIDKVRQHQVQLLSSVSGGPQQYTGRGLDLTHRRLGVTGEHFDRAVGHLAGTLDAKQFRGAGGAVGRSARLLPKTSEIHSRRGEHVTGDADHRLTWTSC